MQTASMTLAFLETMDFVAHVGGKQVFIKATPVDSDGNPSGTPVDLVSSDPSTGRLTFEQQDGNSPAGVQGLQAGVVTITATARDNPAITASLSITCA